MPRLMLVACLGILMAGCVSDADLIAQDQRRCAEIGFTPDSPDFRNCVLRFQTVRYQNQAIYSAYYTGGPPYAGRPYDW